MAISYLRKVLRFRLLAQKFSNIKIAETYNFIGIFYFKLEDWENARDFFDKALTIALKEMGNDHKTTKIYSDNLVNSKSKIMNSRHSKRD